MPRSAAAIVNLNGCPPFESHFDPIELLSSRVPFIDPFSYDDCTFRAAAPAPPPSYNGASLSHLRQESYLSMLTNPIPPHPRFHEPYPVPLVPQRIVQLAAITLDTHPEPPRLREVVAERVRLRPDQAIHIFNQRPTKTARTAARLSAKYGVTPKAIRDIWSRRSWAEDTRPYWTLVDELLYE